MTDEEILQKAIQKAIEAGYKPYDGWKWDTTKSLSYQLEVD